MAIDRVVLLVAVLLLIAAPAHADFQTAAGHLEVLSTDTVGTTQSVTSLSFQPKALIFVWNGRTGTADAVGGANARMGIGFATSTTDRRAACTTITDGDNPTTTDRGQTDVAAICTTGGAGAINGLVDIDAILSNGFRLIVDDQLPFTLRIAWLALGGSDITNATTGAFDTGTVTGDLDVTAPGFQADTLLTFSTAQGTTIPAAAGDAGITIGASAGATPTNYTCAMWSDNNVATTNADRYCKSGEVYAGILQNAIDQRGAVSAWLSTGFRINRIEAPAAGRLVHYLALKGGRYVVGDYLTQTDTTTDIVESGFGFSPEALLVVSHNTTESTVDTLQADAELSVGVATTITNPIAFAMLDEVIAAPAQTATAIEITAGHDEIGANISTADAIEGLTAYKTKGADGFTFRMDDADPAQSFAWYWAPGPAAAATTGCKGGLPRVGVGC